MSLSQHSAPGSNAGFSYQFERAMFWLAQSQTGFTVGVETEDDVAVRAPDGSLLLEQDKHSIRDQAKPFGDRSKDLWNTLATWVDALESKEISEASARFLMVTNKVLPECIAKKISCAKSEDEIQECISALQRAAKDPPAHIADQIQRVLRSESRSSLTKLISLCELADASEGTNGPNLRKATLAQLQLPQWCASAADSIANELLGWLHRVALSAWQQNRPAWIKRDHFINQLHAAIDLRKRQIIRERAEYLIPVEDVKIGQTKGSVFVKQLHLITDDEILVDNSIRDFIRCNIEKCRLSAEGNVTDDDWKAFEGALFSRWDKIRARITRMKANDPKKDVGFEIFTDTTEEHREKLAGSDTEQVYLTSGTYHRLADMIRVGWHPEFKQLMAKMTKAT